MPDVSSKIDFDDNLPGSGINKKIYRRRNYLIDRRLQKRAILLGLFIVALVVVSSGVLAYFMLEKAVAGRLWSVHFSGSSTWDFILPIIVKLNLVLFVAIWALVGFILTYRLKKLALSLSRFKHHIAAMAEGRFLGPIMFRKGDPLVPLAQGCNSMNDSMRAKLDEMASVIDEMVSYMDTKGKKAKPEHVQEFILSRLGALNGHLSGIKM